MSIEAVPNPDEDLKHAHMMLQQMNGEELLRATYALEEIIESSSSFQQRLRQQITEAEKSRLVSSEELLAGLGLDKKDFPGLVTTLNEQDESA